MAKTAVGVDKNVRIRVMNRVRVWVKVLVVPPTNIHT